jgi:hypothetical protein
MSVTWRSDVNALSFQPQGHAGQCLIHRRAFQTILGLGSPPTPEQCLASYGELHEVCELAAAAKIRRAALTCEANFHLTSRDVLRTYRTVTLTG